MKSTIFPLIFFLFTHTVFSQVQDSWEHLNGPNGGNIKKIVVDFAGDLYANVSSAGIFRSTDKGQNWKLINKGVAGKEVYDITSDDFGYIYTSVSDGVYWLNSFYDYEEWVLMHKYENNQIFALTLNKDGNIYLGTNSGIYFGKDYDELLQISGAFNGIISNILVNNDGYIFVLSGGEIYRSINKGETWDKISNNLNILPINCLLTLSSDTLFAGTNEGVIYSKDLGDTWIRKSEGLENNIITELYKDIKGNIFAGTYNNGLYKSLDNGNIWGQLGDSFENYHINTITTDEEGKLYTGTSWGIFCTSDNGNKWENKSDGLNSTKILALEISHEDVIGIISDGGGILLSNDNGMTWQQRNNGLGNFFGANCLAFDLEGNMYAGFNYNKGVYRSQDNGENWDSVNDGIEDSNVEDIVIDLRGDILLAIHGKGIFRSINKGYDWMKLDNEIINESIWSLAADSKGKIFAGGDQHIFKSTDDGVTWNRLSFVFKHTDILTLNSEGYIFAGSRLDGLYRSTDEGNSWIKIEEVDKVNDIFISSNNVIFVGTDNGVFKSTDNGENFFSINFGFNDKEVLALSMNTKGDLFAGTYSGGIYHKQSAEKEPLIFPLKVGNRWDYISGWWRPNGESDSDTITYKVIADTIMPNGKVYYLVRPLNYYFFKKYIRAGTEGLYYYDEECDREWLYYDFSTPVNESFFYPRYSCDTVNLFEMFKISNYNENILNKNVTLLRFYYDSGLDDAFEVSLSREFGFINESSASTFANYGIGLIGCEFDGVRYGKLATSIEEDNYSQLNYALYQNYPNPFNPVTCIQFSIGNPGNSIDGIKSQFVTLEVFDILGRRISVLINEEQKPGKYKVNFNAGNLPSGIYFYKLYIGDSAIGKGFTAIKKMILMK